MLAAGGGGTGAAKAFVSCAVCAQGEPAFFKRVDGLGNDVGFKSSSALTSFCGRPAVPAVSSFTSTRYCVILSSLAFFSAASSASWVV